MNARAGEHTGKSMRHLTGDHPSVARQKQWRLRTSWNPTVSNLETRSEGDVLLEIAVRT